MRFLETSAFTRTISSLLDDPLYHTLQLTLLLRPKLGKQIAGCSGLRKLRWSVPGIGKRGGLRVIYHWDPSSETFYMLYAYPKSAKEDLTTQQLRVLARAVHEEFG